MATKKPTPGKELQPWEQRMAERAAQGVATASSTGGASATIKTRGGRFTIDGSVVPENTLNVIVVDWCLDNHMYEGKFDADDMTNPVCFALGRDYKTMAPNPEDVDEPKNDDCYTCPFGGKNAWGSADTGNGKACKNTRRLMVIHESDMEDIASAEVRKLTIPVTSGKAWDGYVKTVFAGHQRDPIGVLTEITIEPDDKTQFKLSFKMLGLVEDDSMQELFDKADTVQDQLFQPYGKDSDEEEEKPKKSSKAVARSAPAKGGKTRR